MLYRRRRIRYFQVATTFGKRFVLRAGYGAVIAVLVVCAIEAYFIQVHFSQSQQESYRRYLGEEQDIASLRTNLWLAGAYVRDFFIRNTPQQASVLRSQLDELQGQDADALKHLASVSPQDAASPGLRNSLNEYWKAINPVPTTMLHATNEQQFDFIQHQIVPLRGELNEALESLKDADQGHLRDFARDIAESRHMAMVRLLVILSGGVLLALLVAGFSLRRAEHLEREADLHHAQVEQTKRELQELSARLLEVEEEGRRRLSRELHDEIGQTLALLQIQITNALAALEAQPTVLREQLERARGLAEKTVQTIRHITLLLRPALLDDLGLVPALQFQLEDFSRRAGIACEFEEENVPENLPDSVKTCVYRVVQEALHNCEKHSGASKVRVRVRREGQDWLLVVVADNGCGFILNEKGMPTRNKGLGLLGIRERAMIAGGSLSINSAPGAGTHVVLRVPLHTTAEGPGSVAANQVAV